MVNIHAESPTLTPTTLAISGMTCEGFARTVERVPGMRRDNAAVDFDLGVAIVNGSAAPSHLIAAVEAAGCGFRFHLQTRARITGENRE